MCGAIRLYPRVWGHTTLSLCVGSYDCILIAGLICYHAHQLWLCLFPSNKSRSLATQLHQSYGQITLYEALHYSLPAHVDHSDRCQQYKFLLFRDHCMRDNPALNGRISSYFSNRMRGQCKDSSIQMLPPKIGRVRMGGVSE